MDSNRRASSREHAAAPARRVALEVLVETERRGAYTREVLKSSTAYRQLDSRDQAFAQRLALGVTATVGCLDDLLNQFLSKPGKVSPRVRMALRIAIFELLYLATPSEVAVSQGVELVRSQASAAAPLANAVLRRVAEGAAGFLVADDAAPEHRAVVRAARRSGLPVWLVRELMASLDGGCFEALVGSQLEPAPVAFHLHPACDAESLVVDSPSPFPGCVVPAHPGALLRSGLLDTAHAVASDEHAQLVATMVTQEGSCLEIGAGRGTKSFVIFAQARRAGIEGRRHVAVDLFEQKCAQNLERLHAAGFNDVRAFAGDATDLSSVLEPLDQGGAPALFDVVLLDAPCSGTGTMRRHPEIPWRLNRSDCQRDLPALQLSLLVAASARVAPGGSLLYATCSVLAAENEGVVDAFLASEAGSGFQLVPVTEAPLFQLEAYQGARELAAGAMTARGMLRTSPARSAADGHFCARLVRLS
uniref:RsmB/NOP family class I SAM-dependent RNA methyltransferase n=1 Tax=Collinsella sp. BA40 TaxID=2560852 RepID=UPI002101F3B3|nr:transcription antitermination factor NusB [Collinsella sp. BA40]